MAVMAAASTMVAAAAAGAQTIPFADTEDASLSEIDIDDRARAWHPVLSFDIRNGDDARGAYDDDDAGLDRLPVHVSFGGAVILRRRADGDGTLFVIGQSSNGFHAPGRDERVRPRAWYESNNLVGLAWRPAQGLTTAITYAIKTSPNGVAPTTHELSLTSLYATDSGLGRLKPRLAVTRRTRGGGGVYTLAGVTPSFALTRRENGPKLGIPAAIGIGWTDFYAPNTQTRLSGNGGLSLSQPIRLGGAKATIQAEVLALVRDDRLRRLDAPNGTTAAVVPHATVSLTMAW